VTNEAPTLSSVQTLYHSYLEALEAQGQRPNVVDYAAFADRVAAQRQELTKRYGPCEFDMSVRVRNGRPKIIIRPRMEQRI